MMPWLQFVENSVKCQAEGNTYVIAEIPNSLFLRMYMDLQSSNETKGYMATTNQMLEK